MYNWQQKDWPNFTYDLSGVEEKLYLFAEQTGLISGVLKSLPENTQMDTIVEFMVYEAIKTSEIEGEYLSRKDVMSSIKNDLGLNKIPEHVADKKAKGISDMIYTVRNTYRQPLSKTQLFAWHKMLLGASKGLKVGTWRSHTSPMQVVSGPIGKEKIHYEAPPSSQVAQEMETFITWFNNTAPGGKNEIKTAPLRSAIAHLYFESIHPFEDGNGRIGRAIAEKALSQGVGRPVLLSLSQTIEAKKNAYYAALESAQKSNKITNWVNYFLDVIIDAQRYTESHIDFTLKKAKFFDRFRDVLNERQLKVVRRILKEGTKGFEGGINAGKYISITKTSKATATRDLQDLLAKEVIKLLGDSGGRSTRYELNF